MLRPGESARVAGQVRTRGRFFGGKEQHAVTVEAKDGSGSGAGVGWGLDDALRDALRILAVTLGVLLVALAVALPVALVAAALGLPTRAVRRRRRRSALDAV